MKYRLPLLALLIVAALEAAPEKAARSGTEKDVQVGRLAQSIPTAQEDADKFIWDEFSRRPETQLFLSYSTEHWRQNFDRFSAALVGKAKKQGYEWRSLRACLAQLLKEPIAQNYAREEIGYLPIGAYRSTRGKQQVWVIFCLWEFATDPAKQVKDFAPPLLDSEAPAALSAPASPIPMGWPTVGHIRMFTYDITDATLIGFVTCD